MKKAIVLDPFPSSVPFIAHHGIIRRLPGGPRLLGAYNGDKMTSKMMDEPHDDFLSLLMDKSIGRANSLKVAIAAEILIVLGTKMVSSCLLSASLNGCARRMSRPLKDRSVSIGVYGVSQISLFDAIEDQNDAQKRENEWE